MSKTKQCCFGIYFNATLQFFDAHVRTIATTYPWSGVTV